MGEVVLIQTQMHKVSGNNCTIQMKPTVGDTGHETKGLQELQQYQKHTIVAHLLRIPKGYASVNPGLLWINIT